MPIYNFHVARGDKPIWLHMYNSIARERPQGNSDS